VSRGINENISYKGRVFHVQTEERGRERPALVCTLFYGGVILSEERLSYDDADVSSGRFQEMLSGIHNQMIENLRNGLYDDKINALPGTGEPVGASGAADPLAILFRTHLLPSLSRDLETELSEQEVLTISEKIPLLKGASEKDRYLLLCAEIYSLIKDRCDMEVFKKFVKRWSSELRFRPDVPGNGPR